MLYFLLSTRHQIFIFQKQSIILGIWQNKWLEFFSYCLTGRKSYNFSDNSNVFSSQHAYYYFWVFLQIFSPENMHHNCGSSGTTTLFSKNPTKHYTAKCCWPMSFEHPINFFTRRIQLRLLHSDEHFWLVVFTQAWGMFR